MLRKQYDPKPSCKLCNSTEMEYVTRKRLNETSTQYYFNCKSCGTQNVSIDVNKPEFYK